MSLSNYPPGFDPKSLDNPAENVELDEDQLLIRVEIKYYCGDGEELVYGTDFEADNIAYLEATIQEEAFRKGEHAVHEWREKELNYKIDRLMDERDDD